MYKTIHTSAGVIRKELTAEEISARLDDAEIRTQVYKDKISAATENEQKLDLILEFLGLR